MASWSDIFANALPYAAFLDQYANSVQHTRWNTAHSRFRLTDQARNLLATFRRRMPVLCLAGTWCGDCINQCPLFDHFACASEKINLRFLDRDTNSAVRDLVIINGGWRVPVVVFLSEDWFEVFRYGERTLSLYRQLVSEHIGPSCPTGLIAPADDTIATLMAEWLAEFERAQLILQLSPRLRQKHGD
jgi:thiol-disulfide isomerase/thioredoxin